MEIDRLGISVTPLTAPQVASKICEAVELNRSLVIGNHNLHGTYLYHTNPEFRQYCDSADFLLIDGWPIWAALKMQDSRAPGPETRIGSSDWLKALFESGNSLTICAIAGTEESAQLAKKAITANYPHIDWLGFDGYTRTSEIDTPLISAISRADIVLVGMGMPLQENWIRENAGLLESKVVANVGGCIDYFAGTQKHAPRWLGRVGLEWVYRFAAAPRRLGARYFVEPFRLLRVLRKERAGA